MEIHRKKNLFDEFDEQLDVSGAAKMAAMIIVICIVSLVILAIR